MEITLGGVHKYEYNVYRAQFYYCKIFVQYEIIVILL